MILGDLSDDLDVILSDLQSCGDPVCDRDLSQLSLVDCEEERLQQLEDQWYDEQDLDYDNDDDFMEELLSS